MTSLSAFIASRRERALRGYAAAMRAKRRRREAGIEVPFGKQRVGINGGRR